MVRRQAVSGTAGYLSLPTPPPSPARRRAVLDTFASKLLHASTCTIIRGGHACVHFHWWPMQPVMRVYSVEEAHHATSPRTLAVEENGYLSQSDACQRDRGFPSVGQTPDASRVCWGEDDMPEKGHLGSERQQRNRKTERMNINRTKGATSMYSNRGQNKYHNCLGCRGGGSNLTIHLDINLGIQMKDVF